MVLKNNKGYTTNTEELYGNTAQICRHIDHTKYLIDQI
jgi:hypothetical protein